MPKKMNRVEMQNYVPKGHSNGGEYTYGNNGQSTNDLTKNAYKSLWNETKDMYDKIYDKHLVYSSGNSLDEIKKNFVKYLYDNHKELIDEKAFREYITNKWKYMLKSTYDKKIYYAYKKYGIDKALDKMIEEQLERSPTGDFLFALRDFSPFFKGLERYKYGAGDFGYGDKSDARIEFDKIYGVSDFIDKNDDIQLNDDVKLYRGLNTTKDFIKNLKKDDSINMRGLSSWSSDKTVAHSFVENSLIKEGNEKVIFIDKTKGKRKAMIYPLSSIGQFLGGKGFNSLQAEFLYSGNANFKVKDIYKNGGINYVEVEQE